MNAGLASAHQKYDQIRHSTLKVAQAQLQSEEPLISVSDIHDHALALARLWEASPKRHPDATWSWVDGVRRYKFVNPASLDVALWFSGILCSLSIGKPTMHGHAMRLDVIEAAPDAHPLEHRVVDINLRVIRTYADAIGATQIRIMRPLNDKLVRHYEKHGYTLVRGKASRHPTFLYKDLN